MSKAKPQGAPPVAPTSPCALRLFSQNTANIWLPFIKELRGRDGSSHPELIEQDAAERIGLVVADAFRDEVQ